ncbi:hypothetical protein AVEN_213865-1 [Araneus ventricosus]|uniref:Uncharacterized protein n=1 Tax=Araneus ventricosus TaxID=182803 RepID=A0A4Y2R0T4_ARAVE|nr:hypothetical protein AVEN_213865-1 [Araneus ventricosus]
MKHGRRLSSVYFRPTKSPSVLSECLRGWLLKGVIQWGKDLLFLPPPSRKHPPSCCSALIGRRNTPLITQMGTRAGWRGQIFKTNVQKFNTNDLISLGLYTRDPPTQDFLTFCLQAVQKS